MIKYSSVCFLDANPNSDTNLYKLCSSNEEANGQTDSNWPVLHSNKKSIEGRGMIRESLMSATRTWKALDWQGQKME